MIKNESVKEKTIGKIFEPYFTTKFNSNGVRVGLNLSYYIVVNQLNGRISVKIDSLGTVSRLNLHFL